MGALYLREQDVDVLLDMRTTIEAVEEALRNLASGGAVNVPRQRAIGQGAIMHTMSAAAPYLGLLGFKAYSTTREHARFLVGIADQATSELVALIEADRLGQLRTGATTGVAVGSLARDDAAEVGLFGSGHQAATQLEAVCAVRPIKEAFVYSRQHDRRERFASEMSVRLGIEVTPVDRPQEAAEELPIVVTATNSREPVFDGSGLAEGTLVCAIGSNWPNRAELDSVAVRRADNIVCDNVECCRLEAGDFNDAIDKGLFDWRQAVNLSDVLTGRAVGRNNRQSVVIFKSVGMAIEDLAAGAKVLALARERGLGIELPV